MEPATVAEQFKLQGEILDVRTYGSGNINDTFLVSMRGVADKYILQRLNGEVFPSPELVMANLRTVTDHLRQRLGNESVDNRWQVAEIISCRQGGDFIVDTRQVYWRMFRYIDRTRSLDRLENSEQAWQVGAGLGGFHRLLSDLDAQTLHDTLPGFHDTPGYLAHYDAVVSSGKVREDDFCRQFVQGRRHCAGILEDARRAGVLADRVMHGDPKVNNFLLGEESGQVVSLIDLDTVKSGLVHYDIGDCLRSCCNSGGEDVDDLEHVRFDTDRCRAILYGYLSEAAAFLSEADYRFLYDAAHLVAFELGLRFYTDYLVGNTYFKIDDPEQNLRRALVQFRLTERIEESETEIRAIVSELRGGLPS